MVNLFYSVAKTLYKNYSVKLKDQRSKINAQNSKLFSSNAQSFNAQRCKVFQNPELLVCSVSMSRWDSIRLGNSDSFL